MIYRYLAKHKSKRYIDSLQDLVKSYNATPHRSLDNIAPKDVNADNAANLWAYMYLRPKKKRKGKTSNVIKKGKKAFRKSLYKYRKGQLVRISNQRRPFQRVYNEQWSYEIFGMAMLNKEFFVEGQPSELSLFDLPPTQVGVENIRIENVRPTSTISDSSPILFDISGQNGLEYLDLFNSQIHVTLRVLHDDNSTLALGDSEDVAPVNLFLQSLFSQIDVSTSG
ncbi:unnamed protein product [Mytilus coruscus]|uniref:Integrase catalytic domain-containing protein n=1 Tax=Mytilus coruscus TaxID=42192 RepID=A0A6J8B8R8_MYTCO|nr:unnamed protein product [Mytilus coruscus]